MIALYRSLLVAGRGRHATNIRLDGLAVGYATGNVERQDMCGPVSDNARPLMMQSQVFVETTLETACLADIDRVPLTVRTHFDENVDAGSR